MPPETPGSTFNVGIGPIVAASEFVVPMTFLIFIGNLGPLSRHNLQVRRSFRGVSSLVVGREGLGEHPIDLVGPPAVVLDDFVRYFGHAPLLMVNSVTLQHTPLNRTPAIVWMAGARPSV
jgi:hypothetical protein